MEDYQKLSLHICNYTFIQTHITVIHTQNQRPIQMSKRCRGRGFPKLHDHPPSSSDGGYWQLYSLWQPTRLASCFALLFLLAGVWVLDCLTWVRFVAKSLPTYCTHTAGLVALWITATKKVIHPLLTYWSFLQQDTLTQSLSWSNSKPASTWIKMLAVRQTLEWMVHCLSIHHWSYSSRLVEQTIKRIIKTASI